MLSRLRIKVGISLIVSIMTLKALSKRITVGSVGHIYTMLL